MWQDAYAKKTYQVGVAFKILQYREHIKLGYKKASGHLIFDVKMAFTWKAWWVKNIHLTPDLEDSKYSGIFSRESVRSALTYAALHQIQFLAADIRNAYLQAPTPENHYIICGLEFGLENVGKQALIVRSLYGRNASGRDFWHNLWSCILFLGFKSKGGDPDVWIRPPTQNNGTLVYEYFLLYTDYCLVVFENTESIPKKEIGRYFELKPDSIGPLSI